MGIAEQQLPFSDRCERLLQYQNVPDLCSVVHHAGQMPDFCPGLTRKEAKPTQRPGSEAVWTLPADEIDQKMAGQCLRLPMVAARPAARSAAAAMCLYSRSSSAKETGFGCSGSWYATRSGGRSRGEQAPSLRRPYQHPPRQPARCYQTDHPLCHPRHRLLQYPHRSLGRPWHPPCLRPRLHCHPRF